MMKVLDRKIKTLFLKQNGDLKDWAMIGIYFWFVLLAVLLAVEIIFR